MNLKAITTRIKNHLSNYHQKKKKENNGKWEENVENIANEPKREYEKDSRNRSKCINTYANSKCFTLCNKVLLRLG